VTEVLLSSFVVALGPAIGEAACAWGLHISSIVAESLEKP